MDLKTKTFYFLLFIAIAISIYYFTSQGSKVTIPKGYEVPNGPVHWHPNLKIIIEGKDIPIFSGIGITSGNRIDLEIGMEGGMSPIHTHEDTGRLHIENLNPSRKPETLTLGYFFKVWGKNFNSTCIFDYCNSAEKKVSMTVNGKANNDFGNYFMHDGDNIIINYG